MEPGVPFTEELRKYLGIVHKRRGLVLACLTVSLVGATLYNYTTRPVYRATAQVLMDRGAQSLTGTRDQIEMAELTDVATQVELMRGRAMAERVVEKLGMQKSLELQSGPLMSPWERFERRFLGRVPTLPVDSAGIPLSPAAAAFRSRLSIEPITGSRLFNVHFQAYDPKAAQDAVNTLAQLYIEETVSMRSSVSSSVTGMLGEQIQAQQEKVKAAEQALRDYEQRSGLSVGEDQANLIDQKVESINQAIVAARMERIQKETQLNLLRNTPPSQWETIPAVMANAVIQSLRNQLGDLQREEARLSQTLGDRHPDMVKVRADIRATEDRMRSETLAFQQSLVASVEASNQQEASLLASLEEAKKEALDLRKTSVDYDLLKREVDNAQQLLGELMKRAGTTDLGAGLRTTNIRLVERAEMPRAPFSPNRKRNYQLALILGLGIGIGLTILLDYLDATIKTPEEVKENLGLAFLGMVPRVEIKHTGAGQRLIVDNPQLRVSEAYRLVRTNLLFTNPEGTGMAVVVSSANPGEGKSTTVANLAASLALNGSKVLAIDADLRRPTLHHHFGLQKSPGLSELTVGRCQASEAVQATRIQGLSLIACGYIPPNPAELLGSTNMRAAIKALRTAYDWVIIDSPPILAMADTAVVTPLTDGLVLVVSAETTARHAALRAADQIRGVNGKVLGVILNRVDLQRNAYYYGHYYGEYYRAYYSSEKKEQVVGPDRRTSRRM
jgi:capsular exopolysaccharide synthesis family protein